MDLFGLQNFTRILQMCFIGIRVESLKSDERNFLIIGLCKPVLWHKCEMLSCYVLVQVARLWKNVSWDPWSLLNGHSVVLDRAQWKGNSHGTQEHILYEGSCHVTNSVFCLEACLVWIRGERNREMENKSERDIETQTEREERKRLLLIGLIKLLPSEPSRFTFHNMAGSSIDPCCSGVLTVKKAAPVCTLYYSYCQRTLARYHWLTLGENKSKHWAAVKMALNLFQGNTAKNSHRG